AIGFGVCASDVCCADGVLRRRRGVIDCRRRIVLGGDRHDDGGRRRSTVTVADRVGEAVGTVVVDGWRIGDCAVGVGQGAAVQGRSEERRGGNVTSGAAV